MKAFLFIGLIIFGMVATEGVIVEERQVEEPIFEDVLAGAETELPRDAMEGEVLVCLDDGDECPDVDEPFIVR